LGDIKSYGKLPLASTGTPPSYPMVSSGDQIKSTLVLLIDNEIKLAGCSYEFAYI
jgi:hypothetical protein